MGNNSPRTLGATDVETLTLRDQKNTPRSGTLGTSCSKQGEQQWAKETVFIGGEYNGKTVSGLKTFFIGGEYWGTTVSGLKMGNNSQWAEDGFYWRLNTDIREPLPLHTKSPTHT